MALVCHVTSSSYHSAKFGGHRHCGSGDISLVCHAILRDQVIKASCDFMVRSLLSHHSPNFGCLRHCGNGDIMVFTLSGDIARPRDESFM